MSKGLFSGSCASAFSASPKTHMIEFPALATFAALVAICCSSPTYAVAQPAQTLTELPSTSAAFRAPANWYRHQKVSGGYLVSFSETATNSNAISLTALDTGESKPVNPTINGVAPSFVTGAAVLGPAKLVITGIQKAAVGPSSSFLAFTDLSGRAVSAVDLGTFAANQVCTTADGTAWVLGQDMAKEGQFWLKANDVDKVPAKDDYDLLRAYDANGKLLSTAIKRSEVKASSQSYLHLHAAQSLVCGAASVGVYLTSPTGSEFQPLWIELNLNDRTTTSWVVEGQPASAKISGLAVPLGNTVYSSFRSVENEGYVSGIYTLSLGTNGVARWVPNIVRADNSLSSAIAPRLKVLGSDGSTLLYVNGASPQDPQAPLVTAARVTQSLSPVSPMPQNVHPLPLPPPPPGGLTDSDAGNVQIVINNADFILKQANSAPTGCYVPAAAQALASLNATVASWKAASQASKRTAAFDSTIKQNVINEESTFNTALQSQSSSVSCAPPRVPPPNPCGHNKFCEPDARPPAAVDTKDWAWHSYSAVNEGSPFGGRFSFVSVDSCRHDCESAYELGLGECALVIGISPTPLGVAVALACMLVENRLNKACYDSCGDDPACPTAPNYIEVSGRSDRRMSPLPNRISLIST